MANLSRARARSRARTRARRGALHRIVINLKVFSYRDDYHRAIR